MTRAEVIRKLKKLRLQDPEHTYWLGDERIAGMHEVLSGIGIIQSRATPNQMDFGKAVHRGVHLLDQNNLKHSSVHERIKPRLAAWSKFLMVTGFRVLRSELMLYHPTYRYGTRIDKDGVMPDGTPCLVEVKTGDPEDWAALQLGGQERALDAWPIFRTRKPRRRIAVQLKANGDYGVTPYTSQRDGDVFLAMVSDFYWRASHGYKVWK